MKNIFFYCVTPWQVVGFDLLRYLQIFFARQSFFHISNSRNKFRFTSLQVRNTKYYPSLFFWYISSIFLTVQCNRRCEAPSNRGCGQPRVDSFSQGLLYILTTTTARMMTIYIFHADAYSGCLSQQMITQSSAQCLSVCLPQLASLY